MSKLSNWFDAHTMRDQHHADADAANVAYWEHATDRRKGIHRVVDTNLERIERRKRNEGRRAIESVEVEE